MISAFCAVQVTLSIIAISLEEREKRVALSQQKSKSFVPNAKKSCIPFLAPPRCEKSGPSIQSPIMAVSFS
jgi:hypothetical protein